MMFRALIGSLLVPFTVETVTAQRTPASATGSSAAHSSDAITSQITPSRTDPVFSPAYLTGPTPYARYTPTFCAELAGRAGAFTAMERRTTWRDRWLETAATRQADSAYAATKRQTTDADVRTCLAPFTITNVEPYELWSLGKAWLGIGDEAKAAEAFTALMQRHASAPVEERAWWLQQLVSTYANVGLSAWKTAFGYLAQLDALGEPAVGFRISARNAWYNVASAIDSVPFMREQATAARALSLTVTGDRQREWIRAILQTVVNLADVDYREAHAKVALDSLDKAMKVYRPVNSFWAHALLRGPLWASATAVSIGAKGPQPKGMFFFYPGQKAPQATLRQPLTGKPTVYIRVGTDVGGNNDMQMYRMLSRVHEQFGDAVNLVALSATSGTYAHRLVKDSVEAEHIRVTMHEYLRLPVTIAVFSAQVTGKDPYGRVIREGDPNSLGQMIMLTDKHGVVRDLTNTVNQRRMLNMIAGLLRESDR